jgi:PII-like signaling protein
VDEECTVLTSYLTERQRAEGVPSGEALIGLYARRRTAASILLRGIEGSGRQQPRAGRSRPQAAGSALTAIAVDTRPNIEAMLDETLRLGRPRLVTIERARLLSGEIEPVRLGEGPGDATRLTVYCRQRDRAYQIPAFEAACELLYRRRIAGATVLTGVDAADTAHARPQHPQFLRRDADVPVMVVAVGAGDRIAMLLPELGAMFRRPLMTIEKVRLCKRDGLFVSRPDAAPGAADAGAGMSAQFKLTVYTSEAARHDGHPVHRAIVGSLNSAGISGATTVRGIWGYHGDHAPHGEHFPRPARHVPVVTTVIAAAEQISAAFDAIDPHTAERGLVTAEAVLAARPTADAPSPALPWIEYLVQPGRRGAHPDHNRPRPLHRRVRCRAGTRRTSAAGRAARLR